MPWELCLMAINLIDLAYKQSPKDYIKILLSSGDYFPGFYRFTMGTRTIEPGQMSVAGLLKLYFEQETTGKIRTRQEWFKKSLQRLDSLDGRLQSRSDYTIYKLLDEKYRSWVTKSNLYEVAVLETNNKKPFLKDETYFFMGAMIRFCDDRVSIGYNDYNETTVENIPVNFEDVTKIINDIYPENFSDIFIPSKVVGKITFDSNDNGTLQIPEHLLQHLLTIDTKSIVIASNTTRSVGLSMRWAKDITLTEYE